MIQDQLLQELLSPVMNGKGNSNNLMSKLSLSNFHAPKTETFFCYLKVFAVEAFDFDLFGL